MPAGLDGNPNPISTPRREQVLDRVAQEVTELRTAGRPPDSHNLTALRELLLDPLRTGPGATYRIAAFDEPTDQPVDGPPHAVSGDEVLVFDGIFLCRRELVGYWDYVVFLEAQARVELDRLGYVMADAPPGGAQLVDHVLRWVRRIDRYSTGMRYYLDSEDPKSRADLVIDNNDLAHPFIVEPGHPG